MPSLGVPELLLILTGVIIIFGVGKLPEVGNALGKGIREFREGQSGEDEKAAARAPESTTGSGATPTQPS